MSSRQHFGSRKYRSYFLIIASRCILFFSVYGQIIAGNTAYQQGLNGKTSEDKVLINQAVFRDCGAIFRDIEYGVITSPNFPKPFPIPIRCQWLIEAKPGNVIVIYFTQFYLRDGFKATEYAFFVDQTLNVGRKELGSISFDEETTHLISNQPMLLLEFEIYDSFNVHMRSMDFFLDVYGFNITFEIVPNAANSKVVRRSDACSVYKCSFTGNCYATQNFDQYYCSCFPGFFGTECEFGPKCNPLHTINDCLNQGFCRYFRGSTVTTCKCNGMYEGEKCERPKLDVQQDCGVKQSSCAESCYKSDHSTLSEKCNCPKGVSTESIPDCISNAKMRYIVSIKVYDSNVDLKHLDKSRYLEIKNGLELAVSFVCLIERA
ncbi:uncharacterized protein B4U79_02272 [Dinothrombium tinctorium]|uniref:Uncharacterized protein n=1 Tax=Dinothrombium tinctorium TaxID=1965070 RepID=A0A3S3P9V1_9ACAR|nr:uncharacterized protein B4U79_15465 [Dinothrombium tinctorium]RWS08303.1 uncharacterized protein B4U79_02272 [Dinothrombium tinctorium]